MNLWIRSQDKKELRSNPKLGIENDYYIVDRYNIDRAIILGQYATEERALEVLDEIQETMCLDEFNYENKEKTSYQDCYRYKSNIIAIYEMPKE